MRILFLGTSAFALATLKRLMESSHTLVGVVTQPDRPRGRGRKVEPSPVKEAARAAGLPALSPDDLASVPFLRVAQQLSADCAVVVAYGRLLPATFFECFRHRAFNLHASLLPQYRGAAPIQWALISGETETGVTLFQIDEQLDHGPIALQAKIPIRPEDTSSTLSDRLAEQGAALVLELLDRLEKGTLSLQPQDERLATRAPRLTKENGRIDWNRTAEEIHNLIRGVQPWPGAFTSLEGKLLKILAATAEREGALSPPKAGPPLAEKHERPPPGTILSADPSTGLWVQTGSGPLQILRLQPEGGKPLAAADFLRGHPILLGTRFRMVN